MPTTTIQKIRDEFLTIFIEKNAIINECLTRLSAELGTLENKLSATHPAVQEIKSFLKGLPDILKSLEADKVIVVKVNPKYSKQDIAEIAGLMRTRGSHTGSPEIVSRLSTIINKMMASLKERDPELKRVGEAMITEAKRLAEASDAIENAEIKLGDQLEAMIGGG